MTIADPLQSPAVATPADVDVHHASWGEHLVYVFFGLWLLVGLSVDGWAHRNQPELESFFTPWHAVFYSGFAGGAAWLAWMVYRRRSRTSSLIEAIPSGYRLAAVGLGVFALGGIGDGIWHTVFGIETSIDALLSPTHLVMLTGILLTVTAPVRAYWRIPGAEIASSFLSFFPVAAAAGLVATAAAFFFMYANGLANWQMTRPYVPYNDDMVAAYGVLSTLVMTVILIGPVFFLLRRWSTPLGTFTFVFLLAGLGLAALDAFEFWWQIIAPLAGGLTADLVVSRSRAGGGTGHDRRTIWSIVVAVPLVMWSVSTLVIHLAWTVRWPPELWLGQIVLAIMVASGLALLASPAPLPPTQPEKLQ